MSPRIEITTYLDHHGRAVIRTVITDDEPRHLASAPNPAPGRTAVELEAQSA